ncbi:MAG: glycoside hydrolase family 2 TIM barrel-domain containing protein [Bacteroidales bacterium]
MLKNTLLVLPLFLSGSLFAQQRDTLLLEKNWKFAKGDYPEAKSVDFNDKKWETVRVPHDWAIYGPFSFHNDVQNLAISQDGQKNAMEHAGRTGGLPFVGTGWYRTKINIPDYDAANRAVIQFDGAMSNSQVYVNGKPAGGWPYGYNSFHLDITEFLQQGENTIAVRLENPNESSRWYPGAGLYRNVRVIVMQDAYIPTWGTQITTPVINKDYAKVNVNTTFCIPENEDPARYSIKTVLKDNKGNEVASVVSPVRLTRAQLKYESPVQNQELTVSNPRLWDLDTPEMYLAESYLYKGEQLKDRYETPFGFRTIELIPDDGFYLNGRKLKIQGVCNHHDLGPLGAAVNEAALRRQIRIMKDMGVNAIRTSHNMPAPEFVRLCDEMGMMVACETFDSWKIPKVPNGYNLIWDEWAEKDLVSAIRHFRNNPSVVMWFIGNEVEEQSTKNGEGGKIAKWLTDICKREDPTRIVTNGMDRPDHFINNNMAGMLDVPGFNYRPFRYQEGYQKLPQRLILGSETASTLSSRGIYKFPIQRQSMKKYDDHQASSYDVEHCLWSDLPEDNFIMHDDLPYTIGEFVWTGFDYLGEPTPYYSDWPSHSSLFGIVDLAGLPKDRYYLYRSHWNKQEETLHMLPHWNWKGKEGDTIPVFVYTSYPSAELFINGKSQGRRTKDLSVGLEASGTKEAMSALERCKRYRLMWMDTQYEPGTVKVVAYDENGKVAAQKEMVTSGEPFAIELSADRQTISADGKDISFVTATVVDKNGNPCLNAVPELSFRVKGAGKYRAAANGDPTDTTVFHSNKMKAFSGKLVVLVQADEKPGDIELSVSGKGLKPGIVKLSAQ